MSGDFQQYFIFESKDGRELLLKPINDPLTLIESRTFHSTGVKFTSSVFFRDFRERLFPSFEGDDNAFTIRCSLEKFGMLFNDDNVARVLDIFDRYNNNYRANKANLIKEIGRVLPDDTEIRSRLNILFPKIYYSNSDLISIMFGVTAEYADMRRREIDELKGSLKKISDLIEKYKFVLSGSRQEILSKIDAEFIVAVENLKIDLETNLGRADFFDKFAFVHEEVSLHYAFSKRKCSWCDSCLKNVEQNNIDSSIYDYALRCSNCSATYHHYRKE